ncbi:hypothetical protein Cri9333_0530 [Crinalium epipsammum PCC 9333]|uniref:Uncharacterized protein n=1 Tax=Crinalium epipsammum PCC 9333 TaxID=1173022 RepID=K9VWE8_9CYAN|nr:hypothetical protein [Crinalium epipsammum]AFZ11485.1 hypothetical protein Cri9333_0530 [Crinalium epipsammum PCC 9333]
MAKITAMPSEIENAIEKLINPGEGCESDSIYLFDDDESWQSGKHKLKNLINCPHTMAWSYGHRLEAIEITENLKLVLTQ